MFSKKLFSRAFYVLLVVLLMNGTASASPLAASLGTGFTYQGKLTDGGVPANGTYDFEFKLYDALSSGSQVGSTITLGDMTVAGGLFTVQLDFGDVFDGLPLFLDIGVRPGASVGSYTLLTPRQQLTATPYAIYASKAPWSGLTGVPAGFADGIDNAGTSSYQNMVIVAKSGGDFTTITAALNSITTASTSNRYLIYVAPGVYNERVTMKQYVDIEGAGELTTKITFNGSATDTTGTVLGANNAELRFLSVENTGGALYAIAMYNSGVTPRLTHVTASASGGVTNNLGVYNVASAPTMTNVTASASGGTYSIGVYNAYVSLPIMIDVGASASGGTNNYGIFNFSSSSPTMKNIIANGSGGTDNRGVYNNTSSSPTMTNVTASASGGTNNYGVINTVSSSPTMKEVAASATGGTTGNYGVYNYSSSSPVMTNIIISSSGGGGSVLNYGVYNSTSSLPTMTNVTVKASGGGETFGVFNTNSLLSPITMTNVTASASGATFNYGFYNIDSYTIINNSILTGKDGTESYGIYTHAVGVDGYVVLVNNSQISGITNTIYNETGTTVSVGASKLSGGTAAAAFGYIACAGVYDESYTFSASTCP